MPDGLKNYCIARERMILNEVAIPSIFPDLLKYLSTSKQVRKALYKRISSYILCNFCLLDNLPNAGKHNNIPQSLNNIKMALPNEQWFFFCVPNSLLFAYFVNNHNVIKKILISENDLSVKI